MSGANMWNFVSVRDESRLNVTGEVVGWGGSVQVSHDPEQTQVQFHSILIARISPTPPWRRDERKNYTMQSPLVGGKSIDRVILSKAFSQSQSSFMTRQQTLWFADIIAVFLLR